jgi:uncharacterized protein YjcR
MKTQEIAVQAGVTPLTVRKWIKAAGLPITPGRYIDYTDEQVAQILAQRCTWWRRLRGLPEPQM